MATPSVTDVFTVPGDFNLTLLDHLIAEPGLTNIACYNELNAGYAHSRGVDASRNGICISILECASGCHLGLALIMIQKIQLCSHGHGCEASPKLNLGSGYISQPMASPEEEMRATFRH
ncbi:hypothetical protein GBA52_014194 [Prunus armeniaca]|nr:hypothetical protein GBA52_014194 [Prunus armeniaca]